MSRAIRIHPENPKCFEFRGKPLMFVTATEHYGSAINRPFRYERYLADAGNSMTLTRLFCLFRELQSPVNPYSTCKPESPDYIAPFPRTGPGRALDGEPKFDLDHGTLSSLTGSTGFFRWHPNLESWSRWSFLATRTSRESGR